MSLVKERPFYEHAAKISALLDGRRTQIRRLVKVQPTEFLGDLLGQPQVYADGDPTPIRCPLGYVGDRLWLREPFAMTLGWVYRATDRIDGIRWNPAPRMPRSVSRLTVEITDVRVQRVQDITEADAVTEGEHPFFERFSCLGGDQCISSGERAIDAPYRASFAITWDEENGDRLPGRASLWSSNPWVWAVTFRAVSP